MELHVCAPRLSMTKECEWQ